MLMWIYGKNKKRKREKITIEKRRNIRNIEACTR